MVYREEALSSSACEPVTMMLGIHQSCQEMLNDVLREAIVDDELLVHNL